MNNNAPQPRKVAIYLRISLDHEMDGLAIERQRETCEDLAKYRGWSIVETYTDQSKSATDRTKIRPAYDRMVADYEAGAFSAIICYDLDRLTRQPRQLEDWIDRAELRGLALITANGDADLSTDGGRMYARVKAAIARGEMERKGARQSAAQKQRATKGKAPKGMRPLGYATNGDLIEDEAQTVRKIYDLFTRLENPESLRSLARGLSGTQVIEELTPRPKHSHAIALERNARRLMSGLEPRDVAPDGPWASSTILGILRNPRYAGYSTYTPKSAQADGSRRRTWKAQILRNDAGEPIKGQWEPIVTEEVWWQVQNILDDQQRVTNTSGSTKRKHLGSGLFKCGECGEHVTGAPRGYGCAGHIVRTGPVIDEFVTSVIAARLQRQDALQQVQAPAQTPQNTSRDAEISVQRAKIQRAQNDYDAEIIEAQDLKRIRDAAKSRIAELEREKLTSTQVGKLLPILGVDDPATVFKEAPLELRRAVIDTFAEVTLLKQPRGKKGFDPNSVEIKWK